MKRAFGIAIFLQYRFIQFFIIVFTKKPVASPNIPGNLHRIRNAKILELKFENHHIKNQYWDNRGYFHHNKSGLYDNFPITITNYATIKVDITTIQQYHKEKT